MSEKYYFEMSGPWYDCACIEVCKIKNVGIGSVACQECENCIDHNSDETGDLEGPDWIKCKELSKATGNPKREEG